MADDRPQAAGLLFGAVASWYAARRFNDWLATNDPTVGPQAGEAKAESIKPRPWWKRPHREDRERMDNSAE